MGTVIQFPQREGTEVLHFDEKHPFGEIGSLTLSLVQEQGREDAPLILLLLGGADGIHPLESFEPTEEGLELAKHTGGIILQALVAAHGTWSE